MRILKNRSVDDWKNLRASEIDEMIKELNEMPDLASIRDHINELSAALNIFKKNKKSSLIDNIHNRTQHLSSLFKGLKEKFAEISEEEAELEKIDKFIRENFYIVNIQNMSGQSSDLHFNKNKPFIIGRNNIAVLHDFSYVSREHLIIKFKRGRFNVESKGAFPTVMLEQKYNQISTTYFSRPLKVEGIVLNQNYYFYMKPSKLNEEGRFVFSIKISSLS